MPSKLDDEAMEFERKPKKLTKYTIPKDHIIFLVPRVTEPLCGYTLFLSKDHGDWVRISKSRI